MSGAGLEDSPGAEPSAPPSPHHDRHIPKPGGVVVAGLCVYEVAATTVNRALDEDLLPTVTVALSRLRWHEVIRRAIWIGILAGMWGTLISVATALTFHVRRLARKALKPVG